MLLLQIVRVVSHLRKGSRSRPLPGFEERIELGANLGAYHLRLQYRLTLQRLRIIGSFIAPFLDNTSGDFSPAIRDEGALQKTYRVIWQVELTPDSIAILRLLCTTGVRMLLLC